MGSRQVQPTLSTEKAAINEKQHLRGKIRRIQFYSPKHQLHYRMLAWIGLLMAGMQTHTEVQVTLSAFSS